MADMVNLMSIISVLSSCHIACCHKDNISIIYYHCSMSLYCLLVSLWFSVCENGLIIDIIKVFNMFEMTTSHWQ